MLVTISCILCNYALLYNSMQRPHRPIEEILVDLRAALTREIDSKRTNQTAIAKATGVSQSTVSRVLRLKRIRIGRSIDRLCNYANIALEGDLPNPANSQVLMDALTEVWDGTLQDAKLLAKIIRCLRQLRS